MRWIISFALVCAIAQAQEPDRASVPFSNPSGPKTVKVHILNGAVTVKGYSGNEVVVEARGRGSRSNSVSPSGGMHRIETRGSGLQVEEDNNVVEITTGAMNRTSDLVIQVPSQVSLRVGTTNNGGIEIENVVGDIDAQALNGPVTIRNVSGAVVAHSLNGKVVVTLDQITAGKPMSFSTLNGDIDVTLPASTKANVKMKTDNGDIYTDFDIVISAANNKPDVETGGSKGKYRVRFDHGTYGAINGGGPEFQFTTLNGRIYIRKK
jgi:DUF4097 and DUF4098 domain-containing protein YvlB